MKYYEFDGSFEGLLTSIFIAFDQKERDIILVRAGTPPTSLFDTRTIIDVQPDQAKRVWTKLQQLIGPTRSMDFYKALLAEDPKSDQAAFCLMYAIFKGQKDALSNFGEDHALYFAQTLKKLNRERHRMTAFVRFRKGKDDLFVADIAPDFNVLPLIKNFFKKRFADQKWLIVDTRRQYGIWYDLKEVIPVELPTAPIETDLPASSPIGLHEKEVHYQQLWQKYYQHTTIQQRINPSLFLRHVPRRYWSKMTEFHLQLDQQCG
jgi:probable DNA metabolism protein